MIPFNFQLYMFGKLKIRKRFFLGGGGSEGWGKSVLEKGQGGGGGGAIERGKV